MVNYQLDGIQLTVTMILQPEGLRVEGPHNVEISQLFSYGHVCITAALWAWPKFRLKQKNLSWSLKPTEMSVDLEKSNYDANVKLSAQQNKQSIWAFLKLIPVLK